MEKEELIRSVSLLLAATIMAKFLHDGDYPPAGATSLIVPRSFRGFRPGGPQSGLPITY